MQARNVQASTVQACNVQARNLQARNMQARNVHARNVQAGNVQACNVQDAVCVSCHSSGSLEGGHPSSAEVIEDTEDFVYYSGFYSLFSAPTVL